LSRIYPSKLLLFGEYTVLNGSQALAIPLDLWSGTWKQFGRTTLAEDSPLYAYVSWLQSHDLISAASAAHMLSDAEEGWTYEANIPVGYGLGSSGAFVAALYDRYITKENSATPASALSMLAKMESYFHGSSSGMDPMVSYSGQAVLRNDRGQYQNIQDPGWPEGFSIYLLDSKAGRSTGPLVHLYKAMLTDHDIRIKIEHELVPMVEHAIHGYLAGAGTLLEQYISVIGQFQREYFSMMIPDPVKDLWDELMEIPGVYVKFCGAGGGGYFMVISTITDEHLDTSYLKKVI
jgi:mevalonate kinase